MGIVCCSVQATTEAKLEPDCESYVQHTDIMFGNHSFNLYVYIIPPVQLVNQYL